MRKKKQYGFSARFNEKPRQCYEYYCNSDETFCYNNNNNNCKTFQKETFLAHADFTKNRTTNILLFIKFDGDGCEEFEAGRQRVKKLKVE